LGREVTKMSDLVDGYFALPCIRPASALLLHQILDAL
jgi:hypothetical protein